MNIKEAEKLGLNTDEVYVSAIRLAEDKFFGSNGGGDYRDDAINFCVKNKLDFGTTGNNAFRMTSRFIKVLCPKCGKEMKEGNGSGDINFSSTDFKCKKCGIDASIQIPVNRGLTFRFKVQE